MSPLPPQSPIQILSFKEQLDNLGASAEEATMILTSATVREEAPCPWEHRSAFYLPSRAHEEKVFCRSWVPVGKDPVGVVFMVHGVNEHIGRHNGLANRLTKEGYAVFGHDHLGHGASGGIKGDIVSFDFLVEDLKSIIKSQKARFPGVPCFLFGHSMGSMVAFRASYEMELESPGHIQAVVFSGFASVTGPAAGSPFGIKALFPITQNKVMSLWLGGFLARVQPHGPLAPVDDTQLSHDETVVRVLREDPLHNTNPITNRTGCEIVKTQLSIKEELASEYTLPFLALHGSKDTITLPQGSQLLFDHAASLDKNLKFYPGMYHEILLEVGKEKVQQDIVDFFNERNTLLNKQPLRR